MRNRSIKKNFWFSYEEDKKLKKLSQDLNVSESGVIRKLLYDTQVKACPPREFYNSIEKINKIGININQLTKIANSTGVIYWNRLNPLLIKLEELIDLLKEEYL